MTQFSLPDFDLETHGDASWQKPHRGTSETMRNLQGNLEWSQTVSLPISPRPVLKAILGVKSLKDKVNALLSQIRLGGCMVANKPGPQGRQRLLESPRHPTVVQLPPENWLRLGRAEQLPTIGDAGCLSSLAHTRRGPKAEVLCANTT